jgi:histidinol-phosphate aminotransferase
MRSSPRSGAYPTFNYHVAGFGGVLHKVPYSGDREDPQALIAKAAEVTPSSSTSPIPTTRWEAGMTRHRPGMIDALPEGTVLALDEAYADTAPEGAIPPLDLSHPRVIRFRTFSKAYGLAGCAWVTGWRRPSSWRPSTASATISGSDGWRRPGPWRRWPTRGT